MSIYDAETPVSNAMTLLRSCIGARIKNLYRSSWFSPDEFQQELGVSDDRVFCLTAGAVILELDNNIIIGFGYIESAASLSIWIERDDQMNWSPTHISLRDEENYILSAENKLYAADRFRAMLGKKIESLRILKKKPQSSLYLDLPNDSGLIISLEDELNLIISFNLIDSPDSLAVICDNELPASASELLEREISIA